MLLPVLLALALMASAASPDAGGLEPPFPGAETSPELTSKLGQALALRRQSQFNEAIELLEAVRRQALAEGHPQVATRALHRTAEVLNALNRRAEAEAAFREAFVEAEKREDPWAMGRAAHELASLLPGPPKLDWRKKALAAQQRAKDFEGLRRTATSLADHFLTDKRPRDAQPYLALIVEASEALSDTASVAKASKHLAHLLLEQGDAAHDPKLLEEGCAYLGKAFVAFERLGKHAEREVSCELAIRYCDEYAPPELPRLRHALHRADADSARRDVRHASNGFPSASLLLRAARAVGTCVQDAREADGAAPALLERECRALLMDALATRDASKPLAELCAAQDVRDLCLLCGLVAPP